MCRWGCEGLLECGPSGRPRRLAATSATGSDASLPGGNIGPDPRQCEKLDGVDLFCAGPLRHPWQDRKAGAQKQALPLNDATGAVPPHKTDPPHRAPGTSDSDCPRAEKVG
ncbi:hypothetical protein GCM10010483_46120 [Actinokineospora diospyrosa]